MHRTRRRSQRRRQWTAAMLVLGTLVAWPAPVAQAQGDDLLDFTYRLTQSTAALTLWTTTPAERVFKDSAPPSETGSEVLVYAAQNEFEPFQVVVQPQSSGPVTINVGSFGAGISTELSQVDYVTVAQVSDSLGRTGPYPDPLWPLTNGATVDLVAGENTAIWITVHVPPSTPYGDYTADVEIGGIAIPVRLHVFDFAIPSEVHTKSQMNFSHNTVLNHYSVGCCGSAYWSYLDMMKQFFIDHRLTPKSPLWSGGLTSSGAPYIDYDCDTKVWTDNDGIWGFEEPAQRYLAGTGLMNGTYTETFNGGTGFPSFMAATFRNNDASADQRPDTFCGQTRSASDWVSGDNPNSPYNQQWFSYISSMESYLDGLGTLDQSYYYFANEPQDQADYDAVAWYSEQLKNAAPDLTLMVSEEPRPEIYDHPTHTGAKIDIWLAVLHAYDPVVSHERAQAHGEETWVYFLHGTRPPFYNPITLDHPGVESKFTGWFLWTYRVRGIAYYSMNSWWQNPWTNPSYAGHNGDLFMLYPPAKDNQPISYGANGHRLVSSIRLELMRDSLEDYEYLYVLNGGQQPQVGQVNAADAQATKIIHSVNSYTRDSEFLYNLRRLIGLKNGGEIASIPDVQPPASHPRAEGEPGDYYINFQDPAGFPTDDPLIVGGHEFMKVGWNEYPANPALGYGWWGDMAHVAAGRASNAPNVLQESVIYDDWGRQKVFEFDLPNGVYSVTLSVGWEGETYGHHQATIEGVPFISDEGTTPTTPYLVRTHLITVVDSKLTMDVGIFAEYTMLNYLTIEAANPAPTEAAGTVVASRAAVAPGAPVTFTASYYAGALEAGGTRAPLQSTVTITTTVGANGQAMTATGNKPPTATMAGNQIVWTTPITAYETVTLTIGAQATTVGQLDCQAEFAGASPASSTAGTLVYAERIYLPLVLR